MSETDTVIDPAAPPTSPPAPDDDAAAQRHAIEAAARRMGWQPLEEWRGERAQWRDAPEFIQRGETELPIVRERFRASERKLTALQEKLDEAIGVVTDVSQRLRTADERAYKRAREDLLRERAAAVEVADSERFNQADEQLRQLDQDARAAAQPQAQQQPQPQAPPAQSAPHPEAIAWLARNPWFTQQQDMAAVATTMHTTLMAEEPTLTVTENLDRVAAQMRAAFPERIGGVAAAAQENPRRSQPGAVGASAGAAGPARAAPRSFDALPQDAKEQFKRYQSMLSGKGKPLTKEEWAASYEW